jgi:GDP-L-fucose synthase
VIVEKNSKVYIAGHRGLVGSALLRHLKEKGYINTVIRTSKELDLRRQADVEIFFQKEKPEYVFLVAAKVGGIEANISNPADFIYDNLAIQSNIIHSAFKTNIRKLLFVSSSCSYPRLCNQPMREEYILSGKPEPTNEYYAIAKICGMKMVEAYYKQYGAAFFSLIFPNIYGIGDNFNLASSHVISALIRKMYEAKIKRLPYVEIWGTGNARREFLYADDVAEASFFLMKNLSGGEILNVGAGKDISIKDLAYLIRNVVGYDGKLLFDTNRPDGMPQKLLDVSRMESYGWIPSVSLEEGIKNTYQWFLQNYKEILRDENDKG